MRGAGVGIIVTTIILMIAFHNYKPTLSAEEIIKEAEKLGMVMPEKTSDDKKPSGTDDEQDTSGKDDSGDTLDDSKMDNGDSNEDSVNQDEGNNEGDANSGEDNSSGERAMVTLVISAGDTSEKVSEKLLSLGVISDVDDFNKWLCITMGLGDKIMCGTFEIPQDATYEEIAETITN